MAAKRNTSAVMYDRVRRYIQKVSKGKGEGWLGIAPSYLAEQLGMDYERAATILKDLEEQGFLYDNGHGNHFNLPDGRVYATRYYMTEKGKHV